MYRNSYFAYSTKLFLLILNYNIKVKWHIVLIGFILLKTRLTDRSAAVLNGLAFPQTAFSWKIFHM